MRSFFRPHTTRSCDPLSVEAIVAIVAIVAIIVEKKTCILPFLFLVKLLSIILTRLSPFPLS